MTISPRNREYETGLLNAVEHLIGELDDLANRSKWISTHFFAAERCLERLMELLVSVVPYLLEQFYTEDDVDVEIMDDFLADEMFKPHTYEYYKEIVRYLNGMHIQCWNMDEAKLKVIVENRRHESFQEFFAKVADFFQDAPVEDPSLYS